MENSILNLNKDDLDKLHDVYQNADPFPHIVIDDFLAPDFAETIASAFDIELEEINADFTKSFEGGYGGDKKRQFSPNGCSLDVQLQFARFNGQSFIESLERLTGIDGLIGDASYEGGGFHRTTRGGRLGIHADFRVHKRLNLRRELNVIIYLNKTWENAWGGGLELWARDKSSCQKVIYPKFNRCVIFQTDTSSYHGHPLPLECPEGTARISAALYYYTGSKLVYAENSRKTTDYIPGENVDFSLRERFRYGLINVLLDYLPPIISRRLLSREK